MVLPVKTPCAKNNYLRQSGGVGGSSDKSLIFGGTVVVNARRDEEHGHNPHAAGRVLCDSVEPHIGGMISGFCLPG